MSEIKRIFIIGHSGAGKGVLGHALAKELGWQFIDANFSLASSMGRSLEEILTRQGKEQFKKCVSEILAYQCSKENIVVATDDSIIDDEKNQKILSTEFVVYLKVSLPVQLERLPPSWPLLPTSDYKKFLDEFRHERDAWYEKVASIVTHSDQDTLETHVKKIISAMP